MEKIDKRISKLNQIVNGRYQDFGPVASKSSLLDALLALYRKVEHDRVTSRKQGSSQQGLEEDLLMFLRQFGVVATEVDNLRISDADFQAVKPIIQYGRLGELRVVRMGRSGPAFMMKSEDKNQILRDCEECSFMDRRDLFCSAASPWFPELFCAFQNPTHIHLVTELIPGGSLRSLLNRHIGQVPESMARFYLAEMTAALHAVHNQGFVCRDFSPSDVFIDCRGHIKLANLTFIRKLDENKQVVTKWSPPSPAYSAPEVVSANHTSRLPASKFSGSRELAMYGVECDWWSLGVMAYEMTFGKNLFVCPESRMFTIANIVNFKERLVFPENSSASDQAKQLIKDLITDSASRVTYYDLCSHRFFMDEQGPLDFEHLHTVEPPFVPTTKSCDDFTYFEERVVNDHRPRRLGGGGGDSGSECQSVRDVWPADLPFIGYTYYRDLDQERPHSPPHKVGETCSPIALSKMTQKMKQKTQELLYMKENVHQMELKENYTRMDLDKLKVALREKDEKLQEIEYSREVVERDLSTYITENVKLKRLLELETQERENTDNRAMMLIEDIREQRAQLDELKDGLARSTRDDLQKTIDKLQFDKDQLRSNLDTVAADNDLLKDELEAERRKAGETITQMNKIRRKDRQSLALVRAADLEATNGDRSRSMGQEALRAAEGKVKVIQAKLDQVTEEKMQLQEESVELKRSRDDVSSQLVHTKELLRRFQKQSKEEAGTQSESVSDIKRKLIAAEARNNQLNVDLLEKSQQVKTLASNVSRLSEQLRASERSMEGERAVHHQRAVQLREAVDEMEAELGRERERNQQLLTGRELSQEDQEDSKRIFDTQLHTIADLKGNIKMLEDQLAAIRDRYEFRFERKEHGQRQETRRWAEIVGEMKQEKVYLETKLEQTQHQLDSLKDVESSFKGRITRSREEVQKQKEEHLNEVKRLKEEVRIIRMTFVETKSERDSLKRTNEALSSSENELRAQLDAKEQLLTEQRTQMKCREQEIESQMAATECDFEMIGELEAELVRLSTKCTSLESENKLLKEQARQAVELKVKVGESERAQSDLVKEVGQLKELCLEMDGQLEDLGELNDSYEQRQNEYEAERMILEVALNKARKNEREAVNSGQETDRQKEDLEERLERVQEQLEEEASRHRKEVGRFEKERKNSRKILKDLNQQMSDLESLKCDLEQKIKILHRRLNLDQDEIIKLKEESLELRTRLSEEEESAYQLRRELEWAEENIDLLSEERQSDQHAMEDLMLSREHDRYQMTSMMSQQTKLIDHLQEKTETKSKKKNPVARLFSRKEAGKPSSRDFMLESERARRQKLEEEINALKAERLSAKIQTVHGEDAPMLKARPRTPIVAPASKTFGDTDSSEDETESEAATDCYIATVTETDSQGQTVAEIPRAHCDRPKGGPHRFCRGINTRATICSVCLDNVPFAKTAVKCQECGVTVHPECQGELPTSCGEMTLPSSSAAVGEKGRVITDRNGGVNSAGGVKPANLTLVQLAGWLKVYSTSTSEWDKVFAVLERTHLAFYMSDDTESESPLDQFDLRPSPSREVMISSAVSPGDFPIASPVDLPYILKLTHNDKKGHLLRELFLLTGSFVEKQKWVSKLEAVTVSGNLMEACHISKESSLVASRVLRLSGPSQSDLNCCSWADSQKGALLLGAHQGLFTVELSQAARPLLRVEGVGGVYQMDRVPSSDTLLLIHGPKRWLSSVSSSSLGSSVSTALASPSSPPRITLTSVANIQDCLLVSACKSEGSIVILAATYSSVILLRYNSHLRQYVVSKNIPTKVPCTCALTTSSCAIFGTDKFYSISYDTLDYQEFLFSRLQEGDYRSDPLGVVSLTSQRGSSEFLCCYKEVGVFVDGKGRKTRAEDIKWNGVPLSFVYEDPYLYVFYGTAVQVVGPLVDTGLSWRNLQTFLNISAPRFLGSALPPDNFKDVKSQTSPIFMASVQGRCTDIVLFRGNVSPSHVALLKAAAAEEATGIKENHGSRRPVHMKPGAVAHHRQVLREQNRGHGGRHDNSYSSLSSGSEYDPAAMFEGMSQKSFGFPSDTEDSQGQ